LIFERREPIRRGACAVAAAARHPEIAALPQATRWRADREEKSL